MDDNKLREMEQKIQKIEAKNRMTSGSFLANVLLGLTHTFTLIPRSLGLWSGGKLERGKIIPGSNTGKPYHKEIDVGRNEPCPCGSGKKFKHCCLRQ